MHICIDTTLEEQDSKVPQEHWQLPCIALLYFAIRLESRKSANKRIYLSIYLKRVIKQLSLLGTYSITQVKYYKREN